MVDGGGKPQLPEGEDLTDLRSSVFINSFSFLSSRDWCESYLYNMRLVRKALIIYYSSREI